MDHPAIAITEQQSWLRPLVVGLLRDENEAEDVLQDVTLAALHLGQPVKKAWMAKVARGLCIDLLRRRTSRARRERAAARPEATDSTADIVTQAASCKMLMDTVMALKEPLCTTVLKRFWEGKPPRVIAEEMGVPVETVRTRLKTALARIRAKMDRANGGDRQAWAAPLVTYLSMSANRASAAGAVSADAVATPAAPTVDTALLTATPAVEPAARSTPGLLALGFLALGAAGVLVYLAGTAQTPPVSADGSADSSGQRGEEGVAGAEGVRGGVARAPSGSSTRELLPDASQLVIGECVDGGDGQPLPGVPVQLYEVGAEEPLARTTSLADGTFRLELRRTDATEVQFVFGQEGHRVKVMRWYWPRELRELSVGAVALPRGALAAGAPAGAVADNVLLRLLGETQSHGAEIEGREPMLLREAMVGGMRRLRVQVVDERSGVALEHYGVAASPQGLTDHAVPEWECLLVGVHPGGIAEVLAPSGPFVLSVRPPTDSGLSSRRLVLDGPGDDAVLRVSLRTARARVAVAHLGEPLADVEVLLVERLQSARSRRLWRVVRSVRTGRDGVLDSVVPEQAELFVAVRTPKWVAPMTRLDVSQARSLQLQVVRAGTLRGSVQSGGLRAPVGDLAVELRCGDATPEGRRWLWPEPAEPDTNGGFEIVGCPPGSWDVRVRFTLPGSVSARRESYERTVESLAGVAPGQLREIRIPAQVWAPGRAHLAVIDDDRAPVRNQLLTIWADDPVTARGMMRVGGLPVRTDDHGDIEGLWLPPGRYRVWRHDAKARGDEPFSVLTDDELRSTARVRSRQLVVDFVDPDGQPLSGRAVAWSAERRSDGELDRLRPIGKTDEQGRFASPVFPSGAAHYYVRQGDDRWQWAGLLDEQLRSEAARVEARFQLGPR